MLLGQRRFIDEFSLIDVAVDSGYESATEYRCYSFSHKIVVRTRKWLTLDVSSFTLISSIAQRLWL